jgi:hypothetical protein
MRSRRRPDGSREPQSRRAVSTVIDVGFAMVFISAAIVMLGLFTGVGLQPGDPTAPEDADRTAEMLGSTTITAEYQLDKTLEEAESTAFEDVEYDRSELRRGEHGPALGLVADAAVANVTFAAGGDAARLSPAAAEYERAVDGAVRELVTGAKHETQVVAVWAPYTGADVRGTARAGPAPPEGVDVNSVTVTVSSGIDEARGDAVDAAAGGGDYEAVAEPVAEAIVEAYLPPASSQRALESSGLDRQLTVERYVRMATLLEGTHPDDLREYDDEGVDLVDRVEGDAETANERLVAALTAQLADDLEATYEDPETAAEAVSTAEVEVVVRVWNTEDEP